MCWGIECGDGWFEPIYNLACAAEEVNRMLAPINAGVFADQVKQKWAGLRFYWSLGSLDDDKAVECENGGDAEHLVENAGRIMDALVLKAETECDHTCEVCGKHGGFEGDLVTCGGWLTVQCRECAQRRQREQGLIYDFSAGFDFLSPFEDDAEVKIGDRKYKTFIGAYYGELRPEYSSAFCGIAHAKDAQNAAIGLGIAQADDHAVEVMKAVLRERYLQHSYERESLSGVAGTAIEWRNRLHENFWGACICEDCRGKERHNHYGRLLMELAEEFKDDDIEDKA